MENKVETLVTKVAIKTPPEKFYNFFKFNANDLCNVFPATFTGVELLDGEDGNVGCCKQWNYILGEIPMTVKAETEALDDAGRSITWVFLQGDIMLLYKSFKVTLSVSECSVEWKPPQEVYIPVIIMTSNLVDAYLLQLRPKPIGMYVL